MKQPQTLTVISGANSFDEVRFADHHLATGLARYGPVLFVDPPRSPLRAPDGFGAPPGVRRVGRNLIRYTPRVLPAPERPGVVHWTARVMRRGISRAAQAIGHPVGAHIAASVLTPLFDPRRDRARVFWWQDDFVGGADLMGVAPERNARGERDMLRNADYVVAANPLLAVRSREAGAQTQLIPFGCDLSAFATRTVGAPPTDLAIAPGYAVLMGQLGPRVDLALLHAIVDRAIPLLLIGPMHDERARQLWAPLIGRPEVQWVGPKPVSELSRYLAAASVGLVPYLQSRFNQGSFPLKTLEYLAAGLPVVATDLPAIRWLDAPDVAVADTPHEFATAAAAAQTTSVSPRALDARRAFVVPHTWPARTAQWAELLAELSAREELACGL